MKEFIINTNVETYGEVLHLISQHKVENLTTKKSQKQIKFKLYLSCTVKFLISPMMKIK